ncbi:hypothetical protein [Oerskovia paurometabola]|uniref:hypothetical protein n=1 Tax=Oerskovia paurometabola TaxID=162170 RepID=UPI00381E5424
MATPAVEFTVVGVDRASGTFDDVGASAERSSERIRASSDEAAAGLERTAEGADTLASKGSQAAGALSGLGELIGGPFGTGMQVGGVAMQAAADAGDLLNVAVEGGRAALAAAGTAMKSFAAFTKLDVAAKGVATAAQWAWNAALSANPIGIVVVAIAALVAGLVWFFTQTETGQAIVQAAWAGIKNAVSAVTDWWTNTALPAIKVGWQVITVAFKDGKEKVTGFLNGALEVIKKVWGFSPIGLIVNNFGAIVEFFKGLPGKIGSALGGVGESIKSAFKAPFNAVAGFWNRSIGGLSFTVPKWVPGMGGKGFSFPKIPMLAKGGNITRAGMAIVGEAGPELLKLPAGAQVSPLARGEGGAGRSVSIQITNHYPQAEPTSTTTNRALQLAAALGVA